MAHTAQVSFRIDESVKQNAEDVLEDLGLTLSVAITVFLKKVGRERRIPFDLSVDPFYSRENISELEKRAADIRSGKSSLKEHDLIEEDE